MTRAFHPLADIFPLMRGAEFDELVADIKKNGLIEPIVLLEDKILDERNRYRACIVAKVDPTFRPFTGDDPAAHVTSANIRRRHLNAEQKRALIEKLLQTKPEQSNVAIAKVVKADDKTVAKVRRELETRSEIPNVAVRRDIRGRKQPAKKSRTKKPASPSEVVEKHSVEVSSIETNPIASAWNKATREQQREFALGYYKEIRRAQQKDGLTEHWALSPEQQRVKEIANHAEATVPDDGLDIPDFLRRAPKVAL